MVHFLFMLHYSNRSVVFFFLDGNSDIPRFLPSSIHCYIFLLSQIEKSKAKLAKIKTTTRSVRANQMRIII